MKINEADFLRNTIRNPYYYNNNYLSEEQKKFRDNLIKEHEKSEHLGFDRKTIALLLRARRQRTPETSNLQDILIKVRKQGVEVGYSQILLTKPEMMRVVHCIEKMLKNTQKVLDNVDMSHDKINFLERRFDQDVKLLKKIMDKKFYKVVVK